MDPRTTLQPEHFNPKDCPNKLSELGLWAWEESHYKMRNDSPYGLPDFASLLKPLGKNGLKLLQEKWLQETTDCDKFLKDAQISPELNFWNAFGYKDFLKEQVPVLDVGICYASAIPYTASKTRDITRISVLDHLNYFMEVDLLKQVSKLNEVSETFRQNGIPSEGGGFLLRDRTSRLLCGSSQKVSTCHRLVISDNKAWLADVHVSSEFRRPSACSHDYKMATLRESGINIFHPIEIMKANRIVWLMRGIRCNETMFARPVTNFATIKNMWISVRLMKEIHDSLKNRGLIVPFKLAPSDLSKTLKCGVDARDILMGCTMTITKDVLLSVSQLRNLLSESSLNDASLIDAMESCNSLEALELILWIHMLDCARRRLALESYDGIMPVDPETPFLSNREDEAIDFGDDDVDESFSELLQKATGITDINNLRPFEFVQSEPLPPSLASNLRDSERLAPNEIDGLVYGTSEQTWTLDPVCEPKTTLTRTADGSNRIFTIAGNTGIISYDSNRLLVRKVDRVLRSVKNVTVLGNGVGFDFSRKADEDLFKQNVQTANCFNELVRGDYGAEGLKFALNLVFRGNLKVRKGSGFPTCYLPEYAKHVEAIPVTEFANREIMSRATYIWRNNELVWIPGQGLNAFTVKHNVRKRTVHMTELTETINVSCFKKGAAMITFDVGC